MMVVEASRSAIEGVVDAPPSKSSMQRFIAGALLAKGVSKISSPSFCDDSMASMAIAGALGAEIKIKDDTVVVNGGFNPRQSTVFCGESGLATRLFTPIAALHSGEIVINGKGSLLRRPVRMMEKPLEQLGVTISSNNGYLPVKIKGPLQGGDIQTDGSVSSQFITGLLMALPVAGKDSVLKVDNLVSKPYIDITIRILNKFGICIENESFSKFRIPGSQKYIPGDFTVEGDWSGAAFLMVMAAVGGNAVINNLDFCSAQADKAILEVLNQAGALVSHTGDSIIVNAAPLHGFTFDISDCPDLAPPLAVLALACTGRSVLTGTARLAAKESDRGKILEDTLSSLGGKIHSFNDRIEIEGSGRLKGGHVRAFDDHRIAMALASVSLICSSPVIIDGMECINKSYPGFINDFKKLGGAIKVK